MLRRIGLSNFKCWKELDIELAPITLLFGVNSSGKSAILQSLLMLKQTACGFDRGKHLNFGGGERDYVSMGSYFDVVHEHDARRNLAMRLSWDSHGMIFLVPPGLEPSERNLLSMTYKVSWGLEDYVSISRLRYELDSLESADEWVEVWRGDTNQYCFSSYFSEPGNEDARVAAPESCYALPLIASYGPNKNDILFLQNINEEFELVIQAIQHIGPIRRRPERHYIWTGGKPSLVEPDGANAVEMLVASVREDDGLLHEVRDRLRALDLVENFDVKSIDENQRLFEATAEIGGVQSSLADVGFGVSQVLPVITMLLSAPQGSIILLEQPELHLHPNAQAALADLMLHVAENRQLQLIVESHSEHIVRRMQRRMAEAEAAFAKPENIKMYYCQPGAGGATIDEVEVDRFGQISNWPEKFMGDISGDLHTMLRAALERRSQELESVGIGS